MHNNEQVGFAKVAKLATLLCTQVTLKKKERKKKKKEKEKPADFASYAYQHGKNLKMQADQRRKFFFGSAFRRQPTSLGDTLH